MKGAFLLFIFFAFINASGQVSDSVMKEIETVRSFMDLYKGDVTGKSLPDFTAKDLNGTTYTNNNTRNKQATFISFWFINCPPCIAEIPNLNRLYEMTKNNPDVQFFAITWDSEVDAKQAIKKYDIRFPVLLTSTKESRELTFGRGYPTNMVLDKEGRIYSILTGGWPGSGTDLESFWNWEIEKLSRGDTLVEASKTFRAPKYEAGIFFIDSLSRIQSLKELTNYFKGQSLYIDLWASWCLPCLQEFDQKNNSVDSFLNKHNIARLFISVDNPKAKEAWENLIYKYQVKGYHLLAREELIKDLKRRIYKNGAIDLPRYVIVKEGKIIEANAYPPSDSQKLLMQLAEKLF